MWEEQTQSAPQSSGKKSINNKVFIYAGVGIVILLLIAVSVFFFIQYQNAQKLLAGGGSSQAEVQKVLEKIGKLVELPTNEKPTLATVTDKFKVNNQDFFKKTENGDQVLIYSKNKMAVLYRPSANKIINLATGVSIGQGETTTPTPEVAGISEAPSPTDTPSPTASPTKAAPTATPTATSTPTP